MSWPIHLLGLLPMKVRRLVFAPFILAWTALFAFGAVRFAAAREWGYAAVTAAFTLVFALILWRLLYSAAPATPPTAHRPDPIE